jgi:F-type H+-transporting ATPase subunit beta
MVTRQFTGLDGKYVTVADSVDSCKRICQGEGDSLPEEAFMYVGTLEDAILKSKTLKTT